MGNNIDLKELLGIGVVECPICGKGLGKFDDVDIDCDTSSPTENTLELECYCDNCNNDVVIQFNVQISGRRKD